MRTLPLNEEQQKQLKLLRILYTKDTLKAIKALIKKQSKDMAEDMKQANLFISPSNEGFKTTPELIEAYLWLELIPIAIEKDPNGDYDGENRLGEFEIPYDED